ncbi:hypothetical protein FJT64_007999 [Amphibalanus amphitrite]|uniref:Endonuclease/exonuclease/phosphatase domain-containing protein n=1 Tax=Amphibalanus amphitrite TaxID=1232801 RepID=A0A6A4VSA3_AMPAM|nr:hypothetical protein FJT64_007999 [Amphibalanus amphitrite]
MVASHPGATLVLAGDLNCCLLKPAADSPGHRLTRLLTMYGLRIVNTEHPTYRPANSLLDVIATSRPDLVTRAGVTRCQYGTPHDFTRLVLRCGGAGRPSRPTVQRRCLQKVDSEQFNLQLSEADWSPVLLRERPADKWEEFRAIFLSQLDGVAPVTRVRLSPPGAPPLTADTRQLLAERRQALQAGGQRDRYKELNRQCRGAIRRDQTAHYQRELDKAGPGSVWRVLRPIIGSKKETAFLELLDLLDTQLEERFDMPSMHKVAEVERLLEDAAAGKTYAVPGAVKELYGRNVGVKRLEVQLKMLPDIMTQAATASDSIARDFPYKVAEPDRIVNLSEGGQTYRRLGKQICCDLAYWRQITYEEGHDSPSCSSPSVCCAGCGDEHPSTDPGCPRWLAECQVSLLIRQGWEPRDARHYVATHPDADPTIIPSNSDSVRRPPPNNHSEPDGPAAARTARLRPALRPDRGRILCRRTDWASSQHSMALTCVREAPEALGHQIMDMTN